MVNSGRHAAYCVRAGCQLAKANKVQEMKRFPCPCCQRLIYPSPPSGDYSICPLCGWEDDPIQSADPYYAGGANKLSLLETRAKWLAANPDFAVKSMQYSLFDVVELTEDISIQGLTAGMSGTVVDVYSRPREAYEVEFCDGEGRTVALLALLPYQLKLISRPAAM